MQHKFLESVKVKLKCFLRTLRSLKLSHEEKKGQNLTKHSVFFVDDYADERLRGMPWRFSKPIIENMNKMCVTKHFGTHQINRHTPVLSVKTATQIQECGLTEALCNGRLA